jgi:hypothetical protein
MTLQILYSSKVKVLLAISFLWLLLPFLYAFLQQHLKFAHKFVEMKLTLSFSRRMIRKKSFSSRLGRRLN